MQDCGGGFFGTKDASQLADGWVVVGRCGRHGICSPGKYRLCLYGVAAQPGSYQCLDCSDSDPGSARAIWSWSVDRHSWCGVVPREWTTPLSHYRPSDPGLS